jgi:hypothetical protein
MTAARPDTIHTLLNSPANTTSAAESHVHSLDSPYHNYLR